MRLTKGLVPAAVALLQFFAFPANALTLEIRGDAPSDWILAIGRINVDDDNRLRELIDLHPETRTFVIDSDGGNLAAAIGIGSALREHKFTTMVPPDAGCYSACFFAFVGGTKRIVGVRAELGVHQFSRDWDGDSPESAQQHTQLVAAKVLNHVLAMEVNLAAFEKALNTPPQDMYIFSPEELDRYGLVGSSIVVHGNPPASGDCPWPAGFDFKDPMNLYPGCKR